MTIVGIGHKARRGKDTAAEALVRELGFTRVALADSLKELALEANPIVLTEPAYQNVQLGHNSLKTLVERYGWEHVKDHYPLARQFLQRLGQAGRKVFGEGFWFDVWQRCTFPGDERNIVAPDLRFLNEAEGLKELGAILIRIDRVIPGGTPDSDISEHDLDDFDDWDAVIVNDGSVMDLQRAIVEKVKELTSAVDS